MLVTDAIRRRKRGGIATTSDIGFDVTDCVWWDYVLDDGVPVFDDLSAGSPDSYSNSSGFSDAHIRGAVGSHTNFYNDDTWLDRPNDEFSCAGWFRPNTVSGTEGIFGKTGAAIGDREWEVVRSSSRLFWRLTSNTDVEVLLASAVDSIEVGVWYFIALIWDADQDKQANLMTVFLGDENGTTIHSTGSNSANAATVKNTTQRFGIGDNDRNAGFNGDTDEAVYSDRAFTDAEVLALFNNGKGVTYG